MSFIVHRPQGSQSARELVRALEEEGSFRSKFFEGGRFFRTLASGRRLPIVHRQGDTVVCWGAHAGTVPVGLKTLNNVRAQSKYQDAVVLREKGVATIEVSRTRPQGRAAQPAVAATRAADPALAVVERAIAQAGELGDIVFEAYSRPQPLLRGIQDLVNNLTAAVVALGRPAPPVPAAQPALPATPAANWLGRSNSHVGGADLLTPTQNPDYWVKREELVEEYRVHVFCGKSIRAGKKVLRDGFTANGAGGTQRASWVRSWEGGWKMLYDGVTVKNRHRDLAKAAVTALGLQFGAVDIGKKADGTLIVLELNRAPGIEAGTVDRYKDAIIRWSAGQWPTV